MKHLLSKFKERFEHWRNIHDKYLNAPTDAAFKKWEEAYDNMYRLKNAINYLKNKP